MELNRPRLFESISKGRVGTVMPAWGKVLNEQQIAALSEFVFQQFIQPTAAPSTAAEQTMKNSSAETEGKKKRHNHG
jgi:mono/diheme cytochrome c family protein